MIQDPSFIIKEKCLFHLLISRCSQEKIFFNNLPVFLNPLAEIRMKIDNLGKIFEVIKSYEFFGGIFCCGKH